MCPMMHSLVFFPPFLLVSLLSKSVTKEESERGAMDGPRRAGLLDRPSGRMLLFLFQMIAGAVSAFHGRSLRLVSNNQCLGPPVVQRFYSVSSPQSHFS